jgi:hypothetical protein
VNITGAAAGGGGGYMESRIPLMVSCASKPTLGEESALDSWVRDHYALP